MKKTTREWVKKAEQDWVLAEQGIQSKLPVHDGICFHCQQCAEKYLKGLMEEIGLFNTEDTLPRSAIDRARTLPPNAALFSPWITFSFCFCRGYAVSRQQGQQASGGGRSPLG